MFVVKLLRKEIIASLNFAPSPALVIQTHFDLCYHTVIICGDRAPRSFVFTLHRVVAMTTIGGEVEESYVHI